MIELRPHHVCCLRFFEGKGYSPAFTENAAGVLQTLKREKKFTIKTGADDLCRACPYNGKSCAFHKKTDRYDALAAQKLGLAPGGVYNIDSLWKYVNAALVTEICADCEWAGICRADGAERSELQAARDQ